MVRVLFVCMGNICRSPTAYAVFERFLEQTGLAEQVEIDSAGTHAYHIGKAPDPRAQAAALRRGVDLSPQRARRVEVEDFELFDYVLAMDQDNLSDLLALAPAEHGHKVRLFLDFAPELKVTDVPDPYYGTNSGFDRVLDLVEAASEGLIRHLRSEHF